MEHCKFSEKLLKSNFITGNWLPESKYSGNLENFEKTLLKNKIVLCLVFFKKNPFQYFPCEVFLIFSLESWNQLLLNLEFSWFLLMNLEINLDLELVDSILKSFFWAFYHHQNYLIHTWFIIMKLASTISPFFMMTTLKSRNT